MTKAQWKLFHRLLRLNRREAEAAVTDLAIYGSGYLQVTASGCFWVPFEEVHRRPTTIEGALAQEPQRSIVNEALKWLGSPDQP